MDVRQAKDLIFEKLCAEHKKHGEGASVYWPELPDELGIPSDVFKEAMEVFVVSGGGIEVTLDKDDKYIKLGSGGIAVCDAS